MDKLLTVDLKAINHILTHSMEFHKTDEVHFALGELVGQGLLAVEGAQHKKQRRILSPAFGVQQTRELTPLVWDKSIELRDILLSKCSNAPPGDRQTQVDIFDWLGRAALDMIGLVGFNYSFDSLAAGGGQHSELHEAVRTMMFFDSNSLSFLIPLVFPPARLIPTKRARELARSRAILHRVGGQIVAERKAAVLAGMSSAEKGSLRKSSIEGRDLMSLLIKANLANDVAEDARLSDEDLVSQIPTFIFAGHETTSTALSWTLLLLCRNATAQDKLRAEVSSFPSDTPSMEQLNAMPYLDAVLRESMRVHSPVAESERVAVKDCVIPVDSEYVDRFGKTRREIRLNKGDAILVALREVHLSKEIWGEDALEFIPERWENIPGAAKSIPGVYNNLMSFITGPHACIGYRFALLEAKAVLFTLIRTFAFDFAVPEDQIVRKTMIVGRPYLASETEKGPQMPILIRPVNP
ncbi:cytochrome P450 [Dentipellis sp. KUC8613]|nr:cytochrome P450 [Dentipellis sp. KUC8613]